MGEGIEIQTTTELVRHILDHWKSEQTKALAAEGEQKEKLTVEIRKEQDLEKKLKEARSIAEKMETEYSQIEAKIEAEKRAQIEINSIREKDVLEGRVTLAEFTKKGISEKAIYEKATKETVEEMKHSMVAIRSKNKEILELENQLLKIRVTIRFALLEPAKLLQKSLRDLLEFSEHECSIFIDEIHGSKAELLQSESKLNLALKGQSLSPGHSWIRLTPKEASLVQFDPCLPVDLVQSLKTQMERFKDAETLNIVYYIRSRTVEVTSITRRQ